MTQKKKLHPVKCNWVYNIYIYGFSHDVCSRRFLGYTRISGYEFGSHIKPHLDKLRPVKLSYDTTGFKFQESEGLVFFGRCMFSFVFVMLKKGKCSKHSTFQGCFLYALSNAFYRFLSSNVDVSYRKKQKDHQTNVIHLSGISWHRQVYQSCGWTSRGHWRLDCQSWCAWNETNWNKPHFQISKDVRLQNMMHIMLLYISSVYRHMFFNSQ